MTQMIKIPEYVEFNSKKYQPGETILDGYAKNNYLYIINSGSVDVLYYSEEGDTMRLYSYKKGDIFGEVELFSSSNIPFPVVATEKTDLLMINKDEVLKWLRKDSDFAIYLLGRLSEKILVNTTDKTELRYLSGKKRYLKIMDEHYKNNELKSLTKKKLCLETSLPLRSLNRIIQDCSDIYIYKNRCFYKAKQ